MAEYQPGACNIGRTEQRRRLYAGVGGFVGAAVATAAIVVFGYPPGYLVVTFLLLVAGFVGYLQARWHFCVAFAALARYDLSGSGGDVGSVDRAEWVRRDRLRAMQIVGYSVVAASLVTAVLYATLFLSA